MRSHFLLDPTVVFLNHGSFGACPIEVLEVRRQWEHEMERNPVEFLGRRSAALLLASRQALGNLIGAGADDLVYVPNATTGVNIVAASIDLRPGDEVLVNDLEYGACLATWARVCEQRGATVRGVRVALPFDADAFADELIAAIAPRTRLLFVSHIASTTALRLPVERLVREARARGVLSLVDGAHAPGQIELQLDALGADFYTGNCHKWLCAPKGTGFLHARAEHQPMLHAPVTSWGYLAGDGGYTGFDGYTGRSIFERRMQWQGTRDISACLTVPAAIDWLRAHDWNLHRSRCHQQAISLMHRVCASTGLQPIAPDDGFVQMVAIPVPHRDPAGLRQTLFDQHRIEVPVTQHDGQVLVRVSVQAYNSEADLQALADALRSEGC